VVTRGERAIFLSIEKFDAKAVYSDFGDSRPGVSVLAAIAVDPSTCGDMLPADRLASILRSDAITRQK
jgi:hypothetical protein